MLPIGGYLLIFTFYSGPRSQPLSIYSIPYCRVYLPFSQVQSLYICHSHIMNCNESELVGMGSDPPFPAITNLPFDTHFQAMLKIFLPMIQQSLSSPTSLAASLKGGL